MLWLINESSSCIICAKSLPLWYADCICTLCANDWEGIWKRCSHEKSCATSSMIDANGNLWSLQVIALKQRCHEAFGRQIFVFLQSVNVRARFAEVLSAQNWANCKLFLSQKLRRGWTGRFESWKRGVVCSASVSYKSCLVSSRKNNLGCS